MHQLFCTKWQWKEFVDTVFKGYSWVRITLQMEVDINCLFRQRLRRWSWWPQKHFSMFLKWVSSCSLEFLKTTSCFTIHHWTRVSCGAACAFQSVWMYRVFGKISQKKCKCVILCDNISTIKLSTNPVMRGRSKHIDVRFTFFMTWLLHDLVTDVIIKLVHRS